MEVFMRDISFTATKFEVTDKIAGILHGPDYASHSPLPLNFNVRLFIDRRRGYHKGTGALTLPTVDLGNQFLQDYGDTFGSKALFIRGKKIKFSKSKRDPQLTIVEDIRRLPYQDVRAVEEREKRARELQSDFIALKTLQFGWECRDHVFSPELEYDFSSPSIFSCSLSFDGDRREIRIRFLGPVNSQIIAIRFSQIQWCTANISSLSHLPIIFLSLFSPPAFESHAFGAPKRQRLVALDDTHARVAPYICLAIRLVCIDAAAVSKFRRLSRLAQFQNLSDVDYPVEKRHLFSSVVLDKIDDWLRELEWVVAFQVEALVRSLVVDPTEMLGLRQALTDIINEKGAPYASLVLRRFAVRAKALYGDSNESDEVPESIEQCFMTSQEEYRTQTTYRPPPLKPTDGVFDCLHVVITPTTMFLEGPFPERSNRVIRSYPDHHDCFLRVSFVDEDRLQYRFDREVDGPDFTRLRVGHVLSRGLTVAGKSFKFLAYSQSALKEHAVWFVAEFFDLRTGSLVNASTIIKSLGSFDNLEFDPNLIYCPARYGARVSQAFTATDASISVEVEEIMVKDDTKSETSSWCFTDGVGTISLELARDIWRKLQASRRRARRIKSIPRAFQVRFMGSKGMLSVDYRLDGRAICLRPSMIKFEAPESREIEIAQVFDRPRKYYLNRPLIMILEHLGIPFKTFQSFQDMAVLDAQESAESLGRAARLLEAHGLGNSFRLTSVMLSLEKLGVPLEDSFYQHMLEYAIYHILRELKHRSRIPVPGGWTLVGVADVHKFLNEGQIFSCIKHPDSLETIYLEGPILISRSPTIHPGDVQIVHAIGRPPTNSCFAREPLPNTVVFSTKGDRPLPSCLGGGDLDGDEYNLIPLDTIPSFTPEKTYLPGGYSAAKRKVLDRPSTMDDVADFFVEYINSDVLGIIAVNWMIIADQSTEGLDDHDCLELARLHSDAVDYPKSGQPVSLGAIPKLKFRAKPDWNAPETVNVDSANYYESQRAIGRLFRAIDLPALRMKKNRRRQLWEQDEWTLEDLLEDFHLHDESEDPVRIAVQVRVSEHIDIPLDCEDIIIDNVWQLFQRYISELKTICATHTLSPGRSGMLSEEEAVVGTIVAKCSQPRKRRDMMAKMRELTDQLVRSVREELTGENEGLHSPLERAWVAWKLSLIQGKTNAFGTKSFGWIALGAIFEAIKDIEEALRGNI